MYIIIYLSLPLSFFLSPSSSLPPLSMLLLLATTAALARSTLLAIHGKTAAHKHVALELPGTRPLRHRLETKVNEAETFGMKMFRRRWPEMCGRGIVRVEKLGEEEKMIYEKMKRDERSVRKREKI